MLVGHFMQTLSKLIAAIFIGLLFISEISCGNKIRFGEWTIQNAVASKAHLSWAKFTWSSENIGGRHFEKTAMLIPVEIEGLPYDFRFQFDLGSNLTLLQGNTLNTILKKHPKFDRMLKQNVFKDLVLSFGGIKATTKYCHVKENYGEWLSVSTLTDTIPIHIGTIGADMFQNKILIIDYPNQRFAVCDTLPNSLQPTFTKITLDELGRVMLPLQLKERTYKVMFDNGSSLFPLIMANNKIDAFSTATNTDTITTSSWGTIYKFIGRPLNKEFQLAGQTFSNVIVYADYRHEAKTNDYDAIAGNALFWEKTVIVDFKNKRFGVK